MRAHPAGPRHGEVLTVPGAPSRPETPERLNALDASIWPRGVRRSDDPADHGAMQVAGLDVRDLAREFRTPLLVMDESDFRYRAASFSAAFDNAGQGRVYYAAKAFLTSTIARWCIEEGLSIDVCTAGELACALRAGVPGDRLIMHGNNKSSDELGRALDARVGRIVIDSFEEIARLGFLAAQRDVVADVLVRITVGVEAHTHEFIATAHEDQKFGFSLSGGSAFEAVRRIEALPSLRLVGLHSHIGSQIFDSAGFEVAAHRVVGFAASVSRDLGITVGELNLGGGMGIAYVDGDDPLNVDDMASQLRRIVERECEASGLPMPTIAVEPGRAIVGPTTITLYEVGTVKPVELDQGQVRTYVSVDGGMSDNIRTALYDADYTVRLASRVSEAPAMLTRIVGKHCESGDIVVRDAWLPSDIAPGDLLALAATGAYCRPMASNYNYIPRPAVVAVRDGLPQVLLRRETEDDLFALDMGLGD
ncbi:MAG: diaminopimelate decarboxylase [Actinomycetes bacterium]